MKNFFTITIVFLFVFHVLSQDSLNVEGLQMLLKLDSIERTLKFQTGSVEFDNAKVTIPKGFRFLDKENSRKVLTDLWGNPEDESTLGMLVPDSTSFLDGSAWAFTISFEEMGFVKDNDADDINYDDLLADGRKEMVDANKEREAQGYQAIHWVGWASPPYYDKTTKILHWAKELKFGEDSLNTLNYNLRVLGRKGVYIINAIASMEDLDKVKASMANVTNSLQYKEGHRYADYTEGSDHVAEWTVGGLVAGKILSKVGFFAIILKFWKVIALGLAAFGGTIFNFFRRKKDEDDISDDNNVGIPNDANEGGIINPNIDAPGTSNEVNNKSSFNYDEHNTTEPTDLGETDDSKEK